MKKNFIKLSIIFFIVFSFVVIFIYGLNPKYGLTSEQLKKHDNLTAEQTIKIFSYYTNKGNLNEINNILSPNVLEEFKGSEQDKSCNNEKYSSNSIFLTNIEQIEKENNSNRKIYERRIYLTYWSDNLLVKLGYKPNNKNATYSTEIELIKETKDSNWIILNVGNPI